MKSVGTQVVEIIVVNYDAEKVALSRFELGDMSQKLKTRDLFRAFCCTGFVHFQLAVSLQVQSKVDMGKMGPVLGGSTEGFSVADVRVACLDTLDLLFNKPVICRRNTLSLAWRTNREHPLLIKCRWGQKRHPVYLSRGSKSQVVVQRPKVDGLMILDRECLKHGSHVHRQ